MSRQIEENKGKGKEWYFPSLTVWRTYDKRGSVPSHKYFTASAGGRVRGKLEVEKDTRGARLSASKFKVPPSTGGGLNWLYNRRRPMRPRFIYLRPFSFLDRSGGEKRREGGDDASPAPAHILHLITFLKYDPSSAKRFHAIPVFPHPLGRGGVCRASLRGRGGGGEVRRFAGQAPFYMQNFTGRGSEIASRQANEVRRGK